MTITRHSFRPLASRGLLLASCALLLLLGGAGTASAQLPATTPTHIFNDDFSSAWSEPPGPGGWTGFNYDRDDSDPGDWEMYTTPRSCAQLRWMPYVIEENDSDQPAGGDGQHTLVVTETLAGGAIPNAEKTNIRFEFDFQGSHEFMSRPGAAWHITENASIDEMVGDGYFFWFRDLPDRTNTPAQKSNWDLVKMVGGTPTVVASGVVDATADPSWDWFFTVAEDMCYRLRVDYYCGYIRVQVKQFYCQDWTSCTVDSDWLTLVEWVDDFTTYGPELAPGGIGFFSGSDNTNEPDNYFDNFDLWTWGEACTSTEPCGEWSAWGDVNRENLRFKRLYEGAVKDYSVGYVAPQFRIDINTTAPTPGDGLTFCDGWKLLVDLPEPIITSDLDKVRHFLQSTATSVEFLSDGAGTFQFLDNFDDDPLSGAYNPVPMVADGRTPINNSLLDAFDWYVDQREAGGRWEFDPLAECRKWYVVLITDGKESCVPNSEISPPITLTDVQRPDGSGGTYACDATNGAAGKFANPGVAGVEPIPVFTIGFSETVASAPPQLTCISDIADGQYFGARNASELKDALYGVLNQLNTDEERSFTPFKVSPPPSSKGGPATEQDFLVVYPYFQAIKESSLWSGNLFGFRLNESQTTLATDANCEVDATTLVVEDVSGNTWNAAARLTDQLGAGTPERPVLMGQLAAGAWTRHDLTEIPTDATLRLYLRNHMRAPAASTTSRPRRW